MRVGSEGFFELTYCTNIHPANGWDAVEASLQNYAPALKARVAPGVPFGIGLRLSGAESCELLSGDRLERFRGFLETQGLYVFTLNGFPHGPFHHQSVKADVHAPDWRTEERVQYTLRLASILASLLREQTEGGISTSPLSYKAWIDCSDPAVWEQLTGNIVRVAEALVHYARQGKQIHLDIEPEPDGLLENSSEVVDFYQNWLLVAGAKMLAEVLGVPMETAQSHLLNHIRVCWDTCHMAVAYEDPMEVLERFERAGIRVGKVQISSALKVLLADTPRERTRQEQALRPFAESTYLHQVIQRNHDDTLCQYPDLGDALAGIDDPQAAQWRIHFHVPIFVEHYGSFLSTQEDIRRVLALLRERRFSRHLEIETYTWEVLPPALKQDLGDSIGREYGWVLDVFN